jgi:hypothetical protein
MKKLYPTLLVFLFAATSAFAQSVVVPPNLNGTSQFPFTYLSDFIDADTAANGGQLHTVYQLETGGVYFFTDQKNWTFDVRLEAVGDPALGKPLVSRINSAGGTALAPMYRGFGNFEWDGIYIILGEEGADAAQYETAPFRPEGDDKRFVFNDCIIEKSRQGTIRIEGENAKVYITDCIIRNFGDFEKIGGNGRLVDTRENFADTVVIRNCVAHNILDRLFIGFRQQGLNYFEFSNNTIFNHVGRFGCIQLKNTKESIIKDNVFMNPCMMGTSPSLATEQLSWEGQTIYLFTIDTLVEGASLDMSNNNIFWTQDVLDYYADSDSVSQPMVLSPQIEGMLSDPSSAYFTEVLELNNVPDRAPVLQYVREAVMYQDSVGITDMMVEDISLAGTAFDKGYLFDFDEFDPCYDPSLISATAASDGGAVGVRFLCDNYPSSITEHAYNPDLGLKSAPNPASGSTQLSFRLHKTGEVNLSVFDVRGQLIQTLHNGMLMEGNHDVTWDDLGNLATGIYFANLQTEEGRMFVKIFIQR